MNISLGPKLGQVIRNKLSKGLYPSAHEVIAEALRLLDERDQMYEHRLQLLRRDMKPALDDERNGDVEPLDWDEIRNDITRRKTQR